MQFIDDIEKDIFAEFDLGIKTKDFLESEVGSMLYNKALNEVKQCAYALLDDGADVELLRFKAGTARNLIRWINEAINNGENAGQILLTYREN